MKIAIIADNLGNNAPGLVFRNILTGLSKKIEFDIITSTLDYRAPKEHRGSVNYVPQKRIPSWRLRTFCLIYLASIIHRRSGQRISKVY